MIRLFPTPRRLAFATVLLATGLACSAETSLERATAAAPEDMAPENMAPENVAPAVVAPVVAEQTAEAPHPVRGLTGARTRIVWVQDAEEGRDPFAQGVGLRLMGLDTDDGQGERAILATLDSYAKPIITPSGDSVVYSSRTENAVYRVDWDGSNRQRLGDGFGLAVWRDAEGHDWVYGGPAYDDSDFPPYAPVYRARLDAPEIYQQVWESPPIAEDNFQLSADGRRASGAYPWPFCGIGDLERGEFTQLAEGCWPDLSPDNRYILWVFDGSHRNLMMFSPDRDARWTVNINGAPGMNGSEVYHPRWSNRTRVFAVTGPYTVGLLPNKIRGGGTGVEIHVGRFSQDLSAVEAWVPATDNVYGDFYPDVWVDPTGTALAAVELSSAPAAELREAGASRVVVEARLVRAGAMPTPESIAPYRAGLLVNTYSIERVVEGSYDEARIIAAHWVIRDGEMLQNAERGEGQVYRMTLDLYDDHPELEGQRLVMDSDDFSLDLYYDIGS